MEPHDNNALINDYIITIDSVGTNQALVRTNASVEAFNVTGLRPFVNYTFTVAAENDEGVGLASTPVEQRTLEFCECMQWEVGEGLGETNAVQLFSGRHGFHGSLPTIPTFCMVLCSKGWSHKVSVAPSV